MGNFAHNTGEGGISPYHLQGGDLIFQFGTGYFGAGKSVDGVRTFDDEVFTKNALRPEVKMIEIKLSQGAKPGHGGILPAKKNTEEIAAIRAVPPFTEVNSPPYHSAFSNFEEMALFIKRVRNLANGKPVGIKLCVGNEHEINQIFDTFRQMQIYPDFIAVDGGEGGTGSAPLEFTNFIGFPLLEGLSKVISALEERNIRSEIKVLASGKAAEAFDVIKLLALGADGVYMARSFMMSLGCIQARECHKDTCPVGVATQNPTLNKALVVGKKNIRVLNYHQQTLIAVKEMVGAMGLNNLEDLNPIHVLRRNEKGSFQNFKELYFHSEQVKSEKTVNHSMNVN
jgi:glutamate synthase domain-containing protein 2